MNENNDFRSEEQGFSDPNNLYHYNYREQHSAPNEQGWTEADFRREFGKSYL